MTPFELEVLYDLARQAGLETSYYDGLGQSRRPSPESLISILNLLGVPISSVSESREAMRCFRRERAGRLVEPVVVSYEDSPAILNLRVPSSSQSGSLRIRIEPEDEKSRECNLTLDSAAQVGVEEADGLSFSLYRFPIRHRLPVGYHRLLIAFDGREFEVLWLAAPSCVYQGETLGRQWGLFLPVYALETSQSLGAGGFTEMERWIEWIGGRGGSFLGTLPLFPSFLEEPFDPSPYSPVSRLFWNEFYLDPRSSPEWSRCGPALQQFQSPEMRQSIAQLRDDPLVEYRAGMALKRRLLETLADSFFNGGGAESEEFRQFASDRVQGYALFRAAHEKRLESWQNWPDRMRKGVIGNDDYHEKDRRYHLYVQWLAQQQIEKIRKTSVRQGVKLYLDLPLGVHPDGFDVWSYQTTFALGCSGGSPPDAFFTSGQNWGFPPFHPVRQRQMGYRYLRESLHHLMQFSDLLRIDHVMSLHRLFWIPQGAAATEGVYVHYPAAELYAILAIESQRCGCLIVGEDLGTVPPVVRETMEARGMHRMYVGMFEVQPRRDKPFNPVPQAVVASLNTHDTPTFSGFWQGLDIEDRRQMCLLDDQTAGHESEHRRALREELMAHFDVSGDPFSAELQLEVLKRWLFHLAESQARFLLVNLEDLWLETKPQNVPGTTTEKPNWRRKARYRLEDLCKVPGLIDTLQMIDKKRKTSENSAVGGEIGGDHPAAV